jgi:hypothetical protein
MNMPTRMVGAAALIALFVNGCAHDSDAAYPPRPAYATASLDRQAAGCETMAATEAMLCERVLQAASAAAAFQLRRQYDTHASGCPGYAHQGSMARLESCVQRMEAMAAAADPAGAQRRAEAGPRAPATRQAPAFKTIIANWFEALDHKNIACRDRTLSDSHRRECERMHGEMRAVEDTLTAYLVGEGYDRRDFEILGLWPHDRAERISPN